MSNRKSPMQDRFISLAHGNGGRYMRELISEIFHRHLSAPDQEEALDTTLDAAPINVPCAQAFITTDGFIVNPLEFPGGNIGSLAVHGTVNDLAVSGARPLYLTLNAFIEEGLEISQLDRIVASLAQAALDAGVRVVAGDTKVVPRGEGGGLYLATTGVGVRHSSHALGFDQIMPGDCVLVSGPIGDHGIAVMLAREEFEISGDVRSDSASVLPLTEVAMTFDGLRFMRDPTRAGLAGVCWEIAHHASCVVKLNEHQVPVRDAVRMVCDMLGYDPYYLACEGRVVAVIAPHQAEELLRSWNDQDGSEGAAIIGQIEAGAPRIVLTTLVGGERILEDLEEDPLPRIC
jgi:hydrogenase expression/formation protein HypE